MVRGTYRTESGERAEAGDVIDVSDDVVDRLNPATYEVVDSDDENEPSAGVESADADSPPVAEVEVESGEDDEAVPETRSAELPINEDTEEPIPDVPEDYSVLSKMAALYEGDEVHGAMTAEDITAFFETLTPTEVNGLKRRAIDAIGG